MKHADFQEAYLYSNTSGFGNNFDRQSRIFLLSLYFLIPNILFSKNFINISLYSE